MLLSFIFFPFSVFNNKVFWGLKPYTGKKKKASIILALSTFNYFDYF